MPRLSASLALLALLAAPAAVQARRADGAQVRIAVVVGNNVGKHPERALKYAEQEVSRLAGLLKRSGEFGTVLLLRGAGRAEVEQALSRARAQLGEAKAAKRSTLFMFYYSGHGDNDALELGSQRLPLRDLRRWLEVLSEADVRLAFVDACQSGALTGVKGGRRAPEYEVRLADPGQVQGMAIVTSSTANELSQESDDLKGSYFSHNVMAGLQGLADFSRDGQVTLGELYQYTYRRTLADTAATLVGGQHPTWNYRMAGAGDVVLTRTRLSDAQLAFPREAGATWTVFSQGEGARDEVIAEIASSPREELYLALPAGQYRLVRRSLGSVKQRTLALSPGSSTTLQPAEMTPVLLAQNTLRKKGGVMVEVHAEVPMPRNLFGAQLGLQSTVVTGAQSLVGAFGLSYTRTLARPLDLRLRGELSAFDAVLDRGETSSLLRTALALDALYAPVRTERVAFLVGPTIGVPIVRQQHPALGTSYSYGLSYGGVATLALRTGRAAWLTLTGNGGWELFRLNQERTRETTVGVALGGAFAF